MSSAYIQPISHNLFRVHDYGSEGEPIFEKMDFQQYVPNCLCRTMTAIISIIKDLWFGMLAFFSHFSHSHRYKNTIIDIDPNPDALCILIHGLRGYPFMMNPLYEALQETTQNKKVTVFQPNIIKQGNCPLKEASATLLTETLSWARRHPDTPILITGASNGGRQAAYLAVKLKRKHAIKNPVMVSCIGAPLYGSTMTDQPSWRESARKLWRWLIRSPIGGNHHEELVKELSWASTSAQNLTENIRNTELEQVDLYATPADQIVTPFYTGLPRGVKNSSLFLITDEGHSSQISVMKNFWAERCSDFIDKKTAHA